MQDQGGTFLLVYKIVRHVFSVRMPEPTYDVTPANIQWGDRFETLAKSPGQARTPRILSQSRRQGNDSTSNWRARYDICGGASARVEKKGYKVRLLLSDKSAPGG
jgi:hypothetical protein